MVNTNLYDLYRSINLTHINEEEISKYKAYKAAHPDITSENYVTDSKVRYSGGLSMSLHPIYSLPNYHTHAYLEIMYAVNGEFVNIIEGETTILHPGEFCFMPPGVYHSVDTVEEDQAENFLLNICVSVENGINTFEDIIDDASNISSYLKTVFQEATYPKYAIIKCGESENLNSMITLFHLICHSYYKSQKNLLSFNSVDISKTDIFPIAKKLLCCAISYAALTGELTVCDNSIKTTIPAAMILKYIKMHYTTVTLEELSEKYNYSFSHTSRLIKQLTGLNFSKILTRTRLEEACKHLAFTKNSIAEIASQTGYRSIEHFNRMFRREIGMSPTEYRKAVNDGTRPMPDIMM